MNAYLQKLSTIIQPVQRSTAVGAYALSRLPFSLQRRLLDMVLNQAFRSQITDGEFDFLRDKFCKIVLTDYSLSWVIGFNGSALSLEKSVPISVTVSSTIPGFLSLICQDSDPDTLFFDRKLLIEGDTSLGLHIKNMLDGFDEDALNAVWRKALRTLRQLRTQEAM